MATNSISQPAPLTSVPAIAGHAVRGAFYTTELLGVDVQHLARGIVLIAHDGLDRLQGRQTRENGKGEHTSRRAFGDAQCRRNTCLGEALVAQLYDGQSLGRRNSQSLKLNSAEHIQPIGPSHLGSKRHIVVDARGIPLVGQRGKPGRLDAARTVHRRDHGVSRTARPAPPMP